MFLRILLLICMVSLLFVNSSLAVEDDPVLARAGDNVFRKSDLERLISYSPPLLQKQLQKNPGQKVMLIRRIMQQRIISDLARKQGLDREAELKEQLEYMINGFLSGEYLTRIVKKDVTVTGEDLRQYYKDNESKFSTPEQVRARHILIKVSFGSSEAEKKKAGKKAEQIFEWLKKGEKFETLAEQYSEDHNSKKKGGDLGYFPRGRMAKPFEDAVFSMKPGEISDIVETEYGYHIIMAEGRRPAITRTFEEVKDSIRKQITDKMSKSKAGEFIKKATEDAGMEIFPDKITGK